MLNSPVIQVENMSVAFNDGAITATKELSFKINKGEFVCIVGLSGCGKSTILNTIAGFLKPATGEVKVMNTLVSGPSSDRAIVFQNYNLFPWKTVEGNIEFGMLMAGTEQKERLERCRIALDSIGLYERRKSYPHELSGGMRQRVALARAFVNRPEFLLLDEPFGALDFQTRTAMQGLLLNLWRKQGGTILFVTHDVDEALFLADRIIVLTKSPARIREIIPVQFKRPRKSDKILDYECLKIKKEFSIFSMKNIFVCLALEISVAKLALIES